MFLVLLFLTLCLHAVDCPWWQPKTGVVTCGGAATRPRAPAPYRTHPVPVAVAKAAVPAPAPPPLGRTQGRPEGVYTPAAHEGAPARGDGPGPLWGRGAARAVARVPTRQWEGGGLTGGSAAVAPRLPLDQVRPA